MVAPTHDLEALLDESLFPEFAEAEQALLMRLSLLDSFTAEEAAAVGKDPGADGRLRGLLAKNALLNFDPVTGQYRLHDIFRSFLGKRLAASAHDTPELHRAVSECLIKRGDLIRALRFLNKAGRDEDMLRILELLPMPGGSLLLTYFREEVTGVIQAIPWPLRRQRCMEYLAFLYFYLAEAADFHALSLLDEAVPSHPWDANLN